MFGIRAFYISAHCLKLKTINNHNALTHISRNQKAQLLQNLMNERYSPDFSDSEYNVGLIFLH